MFRLAPWGSSCCSTETKCKPSICLSVFPVLNQDIYILCLTEAELCAEFHRSHKLSWMWVGRIWPWPTSCEAESALFLSSLSQVCPWEWLPLFCSLSNQHSFLEVLGSYLLMETEHQAPWGAYGMQICSWQIVSTESLGHKRGKRWERIILCLILVSLLFSLSVYWPAGQWPVKAYLSWEARSPWPLQGKRYASYPQVKTRGENATSSHYYPSIVLQEQEEKNFPPLRWQIPCMKGAVATQKEESDQGCEMTIL